MRKNAFIQLLLICLLLAVSDLSAQAPMAFSLQQAQDYAIENNITLKNAFFDVEIAKKMVKQNTAIGLPQVSAEIGYNDFLNVPTTLLPTAIFGDTIPGRYAALKFGLEYNVSAKASVSQLLYSGQYLVGLQTAKAFLETSKQKFLQEKMSIRDQIAEAYIGVLILEESNTILDSTYQSMVTMVKEAEAVLKQGLIEDIDVDQLKLNQSNIESTIITTRNQRLIAYNFLKFLLGVKIDQTIQLTDNLDFFLASVNHDILMNSAFDYRNNISYTLFQKQEYLVTMQYKLSKTAYQPTLVAFLGTSYNAQRTEWNFFDTHSAWFNTTNFGVTLSVPIWSSGSRKYSVDQARLNVAKMKNSDDQLKTSLNLMAETLKNDFNKSFLVFNNKKQGLETAGKIYDRTSIKYRKGYASSTDLNQKYSQFMVAEGEFTQALFDLLKARVKLTSFLEKV